MQDEPEVSNIDTEAQDSIDTRNAELEAEHEKMKKELKARDKELKKLRKALKKNNKMMEDVLGAMDDGPASEVSEDE